MATEAERLYITLEARLDRYTRDLSQAQATTSARLGAIERRYAAFTASLKTQSSAAALSIGGLFAGLSGAVVGQQLVSLANDWTRLVRSVDAGQKVFGVALEGASRLTDLANEARIDVSSYAALYVRTSAAIRDYGYEAGTAATVTSTLAKALKLGGAAASEQASVLLQFSQALQKGKLDGDEFRSVMENAGVVQELLAEKLKVSKGEIVKLAGEGKLQIGTLIAAMTEGADKVDRIFKGMPATIDEAFAVLRNNVARYIGQIDQARGFSQSFVSILGAMARNLDTVANSAAVLGAALLATMGGRVLSGVIALGARLATLPALFAAGAASAVTFGASTNLSLDRMAEALGQGADLASALTHAMSDASQTATTFSDQVSGLASVISSDLFSAVDGISLALTGQVANWDAVKATAIIAIGAIIGGVKSLWLLIKSSFAVIPVAAEIAFKEMANKVIQVLNGLSTAWTDTINKLLGALNQLSGFNYDLKGPDLIKEFDTTAAYSAASDYSKAITSGLTENFDLKAFAARVQAEADKVAFDRVTKSWTPGTPFEPKQGKPPVTTDPEAEKARKRYDKTIEQARSAIELQRIEGATIGKSAFETEQLKVQTELLNKAREAGVKLGADDIKTIAEISNQMAAAVVQTENMRAAYQLIADETKSFFSDFAKGLKDGESATKLLANGLNRIADKLIDMAVNDLVDQALGGLLGRGGPQSGSSGGLVSGIGAIFGFKDGGVMVPGKGPARLPRFARGGVSNSAAIFGEAGPEAAVPLPDGRRIPVELRLPQMPSASSQPTGNNVTMQLNIDARGATSEGADKLKSDLVPTIQKVVRNEVNQMFDRSSRFAKSGL